jgi:hypothetical protein
VRVRTVAAEEMAAIEAKAAAREVRMWDFSARLPGVVISNCIGANHVLKRIRLSPFPSFFIFLWTRRFVLCSIADHYFDGASLRDAAVSCRANRQSVPTVRVCRPSVPTVRVPTVRVCQPSLSECANCQSVPTVRVSQRLCCRCCVCKQAAQQLHARGFDLASACGFESMRWLVGWLVGWCDDVMRVL